MCGIAGYAGFAKPLQHGQDLLERMIGSLHHRGPDHTGKYYSDAVCFANARLSILDLVGGNQPIFNEDRRIVVVYNGEIYNSPELRDDLRKNGHRFTTTTDTEVLVHLYEQYGDDMVGHLNGMFAFALYDMTSRRLLLARDRSGIKPLFYQYIDGELAFGSEIKALRHHPAFDNSLDPEGIATFLGLFFIPNPWTAYKQVRKLRPGHRLILDSNGLRQECYWQPPLRDKLAITSAQAEEETARLLMQSVKRQLLSDVPVGVLLSSGLDSRSVLAASCKQEPGLRSFTMVFGETNFSEGADAADWARQCASPHQEILLDEQTFCESLLQRYQHLDEPYALWCNVGFAQMAKAIHETGYKVVLSGEGGDETFLGYPTIHAAKAAQYYRMLPQSLRSRVIAPLMDKLPAGGGRMPLSFVLKSFVEADNPDPYRVFFGFKEVVRYAQWSQLLTDEAMDMVGGIDPFIAFDQYRDELKGMNYVDALSYLDFKVFLPSCVLTGNDNAFMASSLELRVPLLDNDLVDFAMRLPLSVRYHPWKLKVVLRNALKKYVLPQTGHQFKQYQKKGFEVPGNTWLKDGCFRQLIGEVLSPERVERVGFFKPEVVGRILQEQLAGNDNHERRLQAIMCLQLFLEREGF